MRAHAADTFGGTAPMPFDARRANVAGVALAAGMTIDSLDGHDGFNPAKGRVGCPLFPATLAFGYQSRASGSEFVTTIVMGYEFGCRAAITQQAAACDHHASESRGAVDGAGPGRQLA
ncbi:MmgE/PrpD family protein [Sedimentitalea sp. JM2-8]|uniref:MmgE/PrpD family protein n=1 Tax=Sedimentitalea xiamensis TaxID=3050037 RepID=A0ABT7FB83_9RHOB|nr:MmgE/PrpD family protein [Sedimentitalea xiamensis]